MAKKARKPRAKKPAKAQDASQMKMTLEEFQRRQRFNLRSPEVAYQHARNIMEKYEQDLLAKKHVIGVDVGMKLQGPASTREFSVWVYVDKKLPPDEAAKLLKKDQIPCYLEDVPTDVMAPNFEQAATPSPPGGTEITPKAVSNPGTLGFDVVSFSDGQIRSLTCTHVVDKSEQVNADTEMLVNSTSASIGTVSKQQGVGWAFSDLLDCAVISSPTPPSRRTGIPGGVKDPIRLRNARPSDVTSELPVWKLGATTGLTDNGIVINHCSNSFPVRRHDGTVMFLKKHIIIKPRMANGRLTSAFALQGDSGAIVCIDDEAIGILRAVELTSDGVPTGKVAAAPIVDASATLGFGI